MRPRLRFQTETLALFRDNCAVRAGGPQSVKAPMLVFCCFITDCNKWSLRKCRLPKAALLMTRALTWTGHLLSEREVLFLDQIKPWLTPGHQQG